MEQVEISKGHNLTAPPEDGDRTVLIPCGVRRATTHYSLVSWSGLQVADICFPLLALPESAISIILTLVLMGYPPVIAVSWLFERLGRRQSSTSVLQERFRLPRISPETLGRGDES